jgi:hypothetical protein
MLWSTFLAKLLQQQLITLCLVTHITVADATTASPPADEYATLSICIPTAAVTTFAATAHLLIFNYVAANQVATAAANAPPTATCPTFAISFTATVLHNTATIGSTPTASLPPPIHLVARAAAAADKATSQWIDHLSTASQATSPSVTTHLFTPIHFIAAKASPNTAPYIFCNSLLIVPPHS